MHRAQSPAVREPKKGECVEHQQEEVCLVHFNDTTSSLLLEQLYKVVWQSSKAGFEHK